MRPRTLREATYCHYVITNIIYCSHAYTSVILASRHFSQLILASHSLFPLLEGSQLAQHASSDEAHGAVDCVWSVVSSWIRGSREAAPQAMGPGDVSAPALPYLLGLIAPSRHQLREREEG